MSLNLNQINLDDTVAQLVEKLNSNFITISKSNGGPEGKKGNSGTGGLPGARGIMGNVGPKGERGAKWFVVNNTSSFPLDSVSFLGDYAIVTGGKNPLDFYEKIGTGNGGWTKRGTFNLTKDFTIDLENVSYLIDDSVANTNLDILINAKTNHTVLLTNIDRPDEDLAPQIPVYDSPGDSYPLIQKGVSSSIDLFDYKLKIYNSGDSVSNANQIYGRNLHLANSYAMLKKEGWANSSGFTFSSDLAADSGSQGVNGVGIEILRLKGESSGNANHVHRVQVDNADLWVSSFRIFKDGTATIGHNSNSYLPTQKIDINGAIRIGTTSVGVAGSIRYSNLGFEGHDGQGWVKLDYNYLDFLDSVRINPNAFNNLLVDTSLTGGVIVGDFTGYLPNLKAGAIRFNRTLNDFEGYDGTKWLTLNNKLTLSTDVGNGGNGGNNSGGGGGGTVTTPDGDPISLKFSVSVDSAVVGLPIYEGIVVTSNDGSLEINPGVIDSKYATLDFSVNSGLGFVDTKGNPIKISELDITSNDIMVNKRIEGEKLTYELTLEKTDLLKELVADSIDIKNLDGTIRVEPPNATRSFWELGLSDLAKEVGFGGGTGTGTGIGIGGSGGGSVVSAMRYTDNSSSDFSDLVLSYSSNFLGHFKHLPFSIKDFDENCTVISVNPLEVSIQSKQNGYYQISSRVRFKITGSTGGTFSEVVLAVVKDNVIISVLETMGVNDIKYQTLSSSKIFELQGTDIIDMGCASGDCADSIKLILLAKYTGLTSGAVNVTIEDSSVSMFKIAAVTKNNLEKTLDDSSLFFKEVELVDDIGDPLSPVSKATSTDNLGIMKISGETDYMSIDITDGVLNIDVDIAKIKSKLIVDAEEPDPDSDTTPSILGPSFNEFDIVSPAGTPPHNHKASTEPLGGKFSFVAGNNVTLALTTTGTPTMTISSNVTTLSAQSTASGSSSIDGITKFKFDGDDFEVTPPVSPNTDVLISMKDFHKTSNMSVNIYNNFLPTTSEAIITQMNLGGLMTGDDGFLVQWFYDGVLKYDSIPYVLPYSSKNTKVIKDDGIGELFTFNYPDSFIFSPTNTGKYEISCMVGYKPMCYIDLAPNEDAKLDFQVKTKSMVTVGLHRVFGGGNIVSPLSLLDGGGVLPQIGSLELLGVLGGGTETFNLSHYGSTEDFLNADTHYINGSMIVELDGAKSYTLALEMGRLANKPDIYYRLENSTYVIGKLSKFVKTKTKLRIMLTETNISIKKL